MIMEELDSEGRESMNETKTDTQIRIIDRDNIGEIFKYVEIERRPKNEKCQNEKT